MTRICNGRPHLKKMKNYQVHKLDKLINVHEVDDIVKSISGRLLFKSIKWATSSQKDEHLLKSLKWTSIKSKEWTGP